MKPQFHRAIPLALLAAGLASCAPRLDAIARYGPLDIEGDVGVSTTGVTATNSTDDLGLDEDDGVFGARVDLDWGGWLLTVSGQEATFDGAGTLTAEISSGGVTLPVGTDVMTDVDIGFYNAALTFDLIPGDMFELGIGLGAEAVTFDGVIVDDLTGEQVTADQVLPFPVLAARGGVWVGPVEATALLTGVVWKVDDDEITYYDLDLLGRWHIIGGDEHLRGSLVVGWRFIGLDAEYEDGGDNVVADLELNGPYVGLQLSL